MQLDIIVLKNWYHFECYIYVHSFLACLRLKRGGVMCFVSTSEDAKVSMLTLEYDDLVNSPEIKQWIKDNPDQFI